MSRRAAARTALVIGLLGASAGCGLDRLGKLAVGDSAPAAGETATPAVDTAGRPQGDDGGAAGDCAEDVCGAECTDLATDPRNCGACGVVCAAVQGEAVCDDGVCVLGDCDEGWGDCDGDPATGCETAVEGCADDCATTCGSVGTVDCTDACAPICLAPVEACTAQDDDCDGACDEGALPGCRQWVYRSSGGLGHVYGLDTAEAAALGQTLENATYFTTYAAETGALVPLYRCDKGGGRRFLTRSATCELGVAPELVVGFVATEATCGAVPLYRLYSSAASNHFYTTSAAERDNAVSAYGYRYESVVAYVWTGL